MTCCCHAHQEAPRVVVPVQPRGDWRECTIRLVREDRSVIVRPATLATRNRLGVLAARLDELWLAAGLGDDLDSLEFDFVGRDGFSPSRRGHPRLAGGLLPLGYLKLESGRVEWEGDDAVSCAYRVKGLSTIVGYTTKASASSAIHAAV